MGGGTHMHPLEPEVGSNILDLHIYSDFFFSYQLTMYQFVHFMIISQILSCTLILFAIIFLRGFI